MIFQRSSEIAIQAMLFLAQQPPGKLTPVHEIAEHAGVSESYLAKVLQRLSNAGLVRSFRGPGKGVELGGAPEAITLSSVIVAAQGSMNLDQCVLGLPICSEEEPCGLHHLTTLDASRALGALASLIPPTREPVKRRGA